MLKDPQSIIEVLEQVLYEYKADPFIHLSWNFEPLTKHWFKAK